MVLLGHVRFFDSFINRQNPLLDTMKIHLTDDQIEELACRMFHRYSENRKKVFANLTDVESNFYIINDEFREQFRQQARDALDLINELNFKE